MKTDSDIIFSRVKDCVDSDGDIYKTLDTYYKYLHEFVPADRISLVRFDFEQECAQIFAQTTGTGSEKTNFSYAIPKKILELLKTGALPEIYIINDPEKDPLGKNLIERTETSDWSMAFMAIKEKAVVNRAIIFSANTRNRFTEKHADTLKNFYDEHKWLLDTISDKYGNVLNVSPEKEPVEDEHEFFREGTRRLCGHLDLETGVLHCLQYISRFLPANALSVSEIAPDIKADLAVVRWTGLFYHRGGAILPWNLEKKSLAEMMAVPQVIITNQPEQDPLVRDYVERLGSDWSAISMLLFHNEKPVGVASLSLEGRNQYNENHMALFSMLHDPFAIALSNNIKHREVIRLKNMIEQDTKKIQEEINVSTETTIVGGTSGLKGVMGSARVIARRESPVLLSGETGVGKEIIAGFIHQQSSRRDGPFVKVNCGAIPDTLIDSELFGHEKGAFTGADTRKKGRFERADGGTILLDEVAELPLPAQVRLLRVLQNKVIERVGGTEPIPVNIRIVAATQCNLEEQVASGRFREDLWFRLNVFPIHIPPLRSRRSDIPALMAHFIEKKIREMNLDIEPDLSPDAMERLIAYDWPGNVRELENVIERELILKKGEALTFENLIPTGSKKASLEMVMTKEDVLPLDEIYTRHIEKALEMTGGKINGSGGAAEKLKIHPSALRKRMDKLGISYGWKRKKIV